MRISMFRSTQHCILYCKDSDFTLKYLLGESNLFPSKFIIYIQSQIWSSQFEVGINTRWIKNFIYCPLYTKYRSSYENNLCEKSSTLTSNLCTNFFDKLFKIKAKSLLKCCFGLDWNFQSSFETSMSGWYFNQHLLDYSVFQTDVIL